MPRTTVVGSFPVPKWVKEDPSRFQEALTQILRLQESIGLDVIGDGELTRWDFERNAPGGMVERFVQPMSGISTEVSPDQAARYRSRPETAYRKNVPGVVVGRLGRGSLDLKGEFQRASRLTGLPLKFTVTSPYMLGRLLLDEFYRDPEELTMSIAGLLARELDGIGAAVVQIDDPHLVGDPGGAALAARSANRVLDAVPDGCERAVHLCFGNYHGQTVQSGDYRLIAHFIDDLHCDHLVLETCHREPEEIRALAGVRPDLGLGIGVVDVKSREIESPDQIAGRIEAAARLIGPERLAYVHPDCGLQHLPIEVACEKLKSLQEGRDLYRGRR